MPRKRPYTNRSEKPFRLCCIQSAFTDSTRSKFSAKANSLMLWCCRSGRRLAMNKEKEEDEERFLFKRVTQKQMLKKLICVHLTNWPTVTSSLLNDVIWRLVFLSCWSNSIQNMILWLLWSLMKMSWLCDLDCARHSRPYYNK